MLTRLPDEDHPPGYWWAALLGVSAIAVGSAVLGGLLIESGQTYVGLLVMLSSLVLPWLLLIRPTRRMRADALAARADTFWSNIVWLGEEPESGYDDDDSGFMSTRAMQHAWYGDNSDLTWRDRVMGEALGIEDGDTYKANWL